LAERRIGRIALIPAVLGTWCVTRKPPFIHELFSEFKTSGGGFGHYSWTWLPSSTTRPGGSL
jgi:hypothetical protein